MNIGPVLAWLSSMNTFEGRLAYFWRVGLQPGGFYAKFTAVIRWHVRLNSGVLWRFSLRVRIIPVEICLVLDRNGRKWTKIVETGRKSTRFGRKLAQGSTSKP